MQDQQTIAIVANCQARPLTTLLETCFKVRCLEPIIVHLANDENAEDYWNSLESADAVISQFISDTYPCAAIRTIQLKQRYGNRLLLIPNLFYKGYTPDLRYIRLKGKPTLAGPLGDYHSSIIIHSWKEGLSQEQAQANYQSETIWEELYLDAASQSLQELRSREQILDIKISDYIEKEQSNQQLFFTFNHPSKHLLEQLAYRIGKHLNLEPRSDYSTASINEPLGRLQAPLHPFTKRQLALQFEGPQLFAGLNTEKTELDPFRTFKLQDIIHHFYQTYNERRNDILTLANLENLIISMPSTNSPIKEPASLEKVLSLFSRLKFEECQRQAQRLIEQEPNHLRAHCIALETCRHLNDKAEIKPLIQSGLNNIKKGRQAFLTTAFEVCAHFQLGRTCRKLAIEISLLAKNTNQPELEVYELRSLEIRHKSKKAVHYALKLQEKFPTNTTICLELIRLLKQYGQYGKAFKKIKDLCGQQPHRWEGYDLKCEELLRRNQPVKASQFLQQAIAKSTPKDNAVNLDAEIAPLHVIQYFTSNPKATANQNEQQNTKLINQKICLQWTCCLEGRGSYQLHDRPSAIAFLKEHYDNNVVDAFRQCGPPAMQADVIRVAHLAHHTHALYIDWPYRPFEPHPLLKNELFQQGVSLIAGKPRPNPANPWSIWNGFGYTCPNGNLQPFFQEILKRIIHNINKRTCNDVFFATGPGLWRQVFDEYKGFNQQIKRIDYPHDLHHIFLPALNKRRSMKGHWSNVQQKESIFIDID